MVRTNHVILLRKDPFPICFPFTLKQKAGVFKLLRFWRAVTNICVFGGQFFFRISLDVRPKRCRYKAAFSNFSGSSVGGAVNLNTEIGKLNYVFVISHKINAWLSMVVVNLKEILFAWATRCSFLVTAPFSKSAWLLYKWLLYTLCSVSVTEKGEVFIWGKGRAGRLGHGDTRDR